MTFSLQDKERSLIERERRRRADAFFCWRKRERKNGKNIKTDRLQWKEKGKKWGFFSGVENRKEKRVDGIL